jgi:hypothetical protein
VATREQPHELRARADVELPVDVAEVYSTVFGLR